MKQIKNKKNPLSGISNFDKDGNLWLDKRIPFGGQMKPSVTPREWFYLLYEACKEEGLPDNDKIPKFIAKDLGSRATQWRTRNILIKKGYL